MLKKFSCLLRKFHVTSKIMWRNFWDNLTQYLGDFHAIFMNISRNYKKKFYSILKRISFNLKENFSQFRRQFRTIFKRISHFKKKFHGIFKRIPLNF